MAYLVTLSKAKEKGWSYTLEASYLEVYCEELRDLLATGNDQDKKLKIEGAGKKHCNVANLTRHQVKSKQQILNLVKRANKRRATASTNVNERSSRSHSGILYMGFELANFSHDLGGKGLATHGYSQVYLDVHIINLNIF